MPEEQKIFIFNDGLPGLPDSREFAFITVQEGLPFYYMQSVKDEKICFILANPFILFPKYEFDLPEAEMNKIEVRDVREVAVFCIVNASKGFKKATVNLLAPIVVNAANGLARQVVLCDSRYTIRHPLPQTKELKEG